MKNYYISRAVLAILFGGMIYLSSHSVLKAVLAAVAVMLIFAYLPRSGRYKVKSEEGMTALRRDEFTQSVAQRAGRNAWVAVTLAGSGMVLYYSQISPGAVPTAQLEILMFFGFLVYFISDLWMRKM